MRYERPVTVVTHAVQDIDGVMEGRLSRACDLQCSKLAQRCHLVTYGRPPVVRRSMGDQVKKL
jgi:hypothetical protein